jgi:hypothetical protein
MHPIHTWSNDAPRAMLQSSKFFRLERGMYGSD